jgi:ribosomal protein L17
MSSLGTFFLGVTPLQSFNAVLPPPVAYDKVTYYGGTTGTTIDSIWGRNEIIDDTTLESYTLANYEPQWTLTTYILSLFDNTLDAGNIVGLTSPILSWLVFRQDPDQTQLRFLKELDVSATSYEDFRALTTKEYSYLVFGQSATELSNPLTSNAITPDHYGWFLIDADDEIPYKFNLNAVSGSNQTDGDYTEFNTNNRTNSFSRGNRNAKRSTVTAVIRDETDCTTVDQTNELLDQFNTFITSTKTKYVKDRRGRIYKVFTFGESEPQWNDSIQEQLVSVTFSYVESGDVFE